MLSIRSMPPAADTVTASACGSGPSSHPGGTRVAADVCVHSDLVADEALSPLAREVVDALGDRAAGLPRRTAIEVGDVGAGWRDQIGRPWPPDELALRRALGGVEYPASRDRLVETCKEHLRRRPSALAWMERLPDGAYALPDEAWLALRQVGP